MINLAYYKKLKNFTSTKVRNLIENGDFSSALSNWSNSSTSTYSTSNNILSITATGDYGYVIGTYSKNMNVNPNDEIFISAKVKLDNDVANRMHLKLSGSVSGTVSYIKNISNPKGNSWYHFTDFLSLPSDFEGNIELEFNHDYSDSTTADGKVMQIKELLLINKTNDLTNTDFNEVDFRDLLKLIPESWFDNEVYTGEIIKGFFNRKQNNIIVRKITDDKFYIFYKPKGSKWIRHDFIRYTNAEINSDVWLTDQIVAGEYKNSSGLENEIKLTNQGSSHEFSYRIYGDDYRGSKHGYESFNNFTLYINGIPANLESGYLKSGSDVKIVEESELLDPADGTTVLAKIYKIWEFDGKGLNYSIRTDWQVNTTLTEALTWQMPVMMTDGVSNLDWADSYSFIGGDGNIVDLTSSNLSNNKAKGFVMWNENSGFAFKCYMLDDWIGQLDSFTDLENGDNLRISSGTDYQKTYFTRLHNDTGQTVSSGTIWEIRTRTEPYFRE
jgi:hypothetical protein